MDTDWVGHWRGKLKLRWVQLPKWERSLKACGYGQARGKQLGFE
ncbi:MAG: hypothetical protein ACTHKU_06415 [Verrucomicrobiota bacterium]